MAEPSSITAEPQFDKALHTKYFLRCLRSLLPTDYTTTDSSRLTLGFFILSALDLLGALPQLTVDEKHNIKKWILSLQHPQGGFVGSPNHKYGDEESKIASKKMPETLRAKDPASLPATFFAILALNFFAPINSFNTISRQATLAWLRKLQRPDGSFGEFIDSTGAIRGGRDMRYCQLAAAIRYLLRGDLAVAGQRSVKDIDVEALVRHVRSAQGFDGGLGESGEGESHAGYTYCGVATLYLLGRTAQGEGLCDPDAAVKWLVSTQTAYLDDDPEQEDQDSNQPTAPIEFSKLALEEVPTYIGSAGRLNKAPDTCYSFWVLASLSMLLSPSSTPLSVIDITPQRRWLLKKTQHMIGGFGKEPGYPPDIYHSYLGLAALSVMGEADLKRLDPALCVSQEAKLKAAQDWETFRKGMAQLQKDDQKWEEEQRDRYKGDYSLPDGGKTKSHEEAQGAWKEKGTSGFLRHPLLEKLDSLMAL
jgi:geranylgeranyl transferase type-1 subunit beta